MELHKNYVHNILELVDSLNLDGQDMPLHCKTNSKITRSR